MSGLQDSLPHHRVKVRPGERKRVPRFPGSWTLKSPRPSPAARSASRPETVLTLEGSKIPGNGGSVTTPSSALLATIPEWGTRKREGPSSCPEQGSLRNPEPHRGSGFRSPLLRARRWTSFSMSGLPGQSSTSQGKSAARRAKEGPQIPWILDPQEPRPSPAARSALAAGDGLPRRSQDPGNGGSVTTPLRLSWPHFIPE